MTGAEQEMWIDSKDWPTHQAHGDKQGGCTTTGTIGGGQKFTICHKIPGTNQTQEIQVTQAEWLIHQKHGDTKGPCSGTK